MFNCLTIWFNHLFMGPTLNSPCGRHRQIWRPNYESVIWLWASQALRPKPDSSKTSWKAKMVRRIMSKPWATEQHELRGVYIGWFLRINIINTMFTVTFHNFYVHPVHPLVPLWARLVPPAQITSTTISRALCQTWVCKGRTSIRGLGPMLQCSEQF